jgi:hypothetical protein
VAELQPSRPSGRREIDLFVMAITVLRVQRVHAAPQNAGVPRRIKGDTMMSLLAFAVVAVALATPFVVPFLWRQIEQD